MRRTPLPAKLILLLLALAAATSASGQSTFSARITITSQCNTQQALFGPQAEPDITVICQPGMTPFLAQSIDLNDEDADPDHDKTAVSSAGEQDQSPSSGTAASRLSSKKILSPPLPSASTFASKVVFVVF